MRRLMLSLTLLLALTASAVAQLSRLDDIMAIGSVRVGMTGDYQPFSLRDAAGGYSGLDVDMANGLAGVLGVKLEIVPTTWANLLPDLAANKFDIGMGGISITLLRQRTAFFSDAVMRVGKTPIARCADKARFETLDDIDHASVRVLVNPGGTNERFDRANLHQAQIVLFPDNTHIFEALIEGKGDVMITDAVEAKLQQKLNPGLCAIHPDEPFDFGELGYLLPRDVALQQFVNQWLHVTVESGVWDQLLEKYLGSQ